MIKTAPFNKFADEYEAWFERYNLVFLSEIEAIKRSFDLLPENIRGIEIGMGSGRYAMELGIKEGIEPAANLRELALEKGLDVIDASAEHLPYKDHSFDFVLFVTIEHLANLKQAISEAYRVLKPGASIILAFIDRLSPLAERYSVSKSKFYKQAQFYSVEKIQQLLEEKGFKDLSYHQCIFDDIDRIQKVEVPKEGFGYGSFVVVSATKKGK